jgi:hypothetical protein
MSENNDREARDRELEALLRGLVPTQLNVDVRAGLEDAFAEVEPDEKAVSSRLPWSRLVPLSLVCLVAMSGFGYFRYGDRLFPQEPKAEVAETGSLDTLSGENFVPVSAHGYLLNASSGGVIETDEGPQERLNLEYHDAYHWHDPDTGTNIRFFQPRSEEVIVPLQTD